MFPSRSTTERSCVALRAPLAVPSSLVVSPLVDAPRPWPGAQPCETRTRWPKRDVLRDQAVLFGSRERFVRLWGLAVGFCEIQAVH
jgi:hypothetical protein